MTRLVCAWLALAAGNVLIADDEVRGTWERVAEHAAWQPRDSQGEAVFNGRMWILGGWYDSYSEGPRDVWSSADGVQWDRVVETAPWRHGDFPMTTVFHDRLWLMGGWHNGRLDTATASREVWATPDGKDWELVTDAAPWPARMAGTVTVFQDKLWVMGGTEQYYFGDESSLKADVWCSADGVHWDCVTPQAPWRPRAYHQTAVLDGKLWVFGGGNYQPGYVALNDVWCSTDGREWECATEAAPWPPRIWFSGLAWQDRLWVLGGWSNDPSRNWNDVWHSRDGVIWTELKTPEVWPVKHELSAFIHDDALWIAGGMTPPLNNDVWRLKLE